MILFIKYKTTVLITIFLFKGCYSVIKKELIKEQIQFDTVVDYLLSEWFKVVLAIVSIYIYL